MDGAPRQEPPIAVWSTLRVVLIAGGLLAVLGGRAADPRWVEEEYVRGWGVAIATGLAQASAWAPFGVAEALIAGLIVLEGWLLLGGLSDVAAGRRKALPAAVSGALHLIRATAVILLWFYVVWGAAYARPSALQRQGWTPPRLDPPEARAQLYAEAAYAVVLANRYYAEVHGAHAPLAQLTAPPEGFDVDAAIDRGFGATARALDLPTTFSRPRGPAKTPRASILMSWGGIGGIYMPFTGEANVNGGPPAFSRIFTTAHEKAHQRMVTSEDEASFYGFLACAHAEEPLLRYAAWEFAARQLLRALSSVDPEGARAIYALTSDGVKADHKAVSDYWAPYEGWMQELSRWFNDHFLKVNRVAGGVASYGRAGTLIVAWLNTPDGVAVSGLPHALTHLTPPEPIEVPPS